MRKNCLILLLLCLSLTGCSSAETFESLGDIDMTPVIREERKVVLSVPDGAEVLSGSTGTLYLCDGFTVAVEVLASGDLNGTLEALTGFGTENLTVIETSAGGQSRYECVWTAAGEGGDTVGRVVILDDGAYHYCLTVESMAQDASSLQKTWEKILDSFQIA